jgi:hypothetical protein
MKSNYALPVPLTARMVGQCSMWVLVPPFGPTASHSMTCNTPSQRGLCTLQDCEALQLANGDADRFAFCGVEAVLGGTVDATAALQPPDAVGTATPLSGRVDPVVSTIDIAKPKSHVVLHLLENLQLKPSILVCKKREPASTELTSHYHAMITSQHPE